MTLREIWDLQAGDWERFVRTPGLDLTNEAFNLPRLLELLPPPGRRTLDLGCGEGRVGRALIPLGHLLVAIDASAGMVALARASQEAVVADAATLPFEAGSFDLVVAFMSLMDFDDPDAAVRETARVLEPGGRFCFCITHPVATAGGFDARSADAPFVLRHPYFEPRRIEDRRQFDGFAIRFAYDHRPLDAWFRGLEDAGFVVEALREHPFPRDAWRDESGARWARVPLFLHVRALRT